MFRFASLSIVALSALCMPAFAADLPTAKSPLQPTFVAAPPAWTGFYVGADLGGVWTSDKLLYDQTFFPTEYTKMNGSGVIGGVFAGYNWQLADHFLLGAEADVEATSIDMKGSIYYIDGYPHHLDGYVSDAIPWQGSLRARFGYVAGPALIYATGGLALAEIDTKFVETATYEGSFSDVRAGWTLGAGLEYALAGGWTARAEYRYTDFARWSDYIPETVNSYYAGSNGHSVIENAVKFGLVYRFGATAPVAAKY